LIDDIYGSAELLASKQASEIKAKVIATKRHQDEVNSVLTDGHYTFDRSTQRTVNYNSGLWYRTTGTELATVKEMGLLNPLSLAWELLPYSFVADWFVPIGGYLNTLDATIGLSFWKGYRSHKFEGTVSDIVSGTGSNLLYRWGGMARGSKSVVSVVRVKLIEFPSLPFPSFKNPFSITHALNAVALVRVAFDFSSKVR
jgi:hypothetical protein